MRQRPFEVHGDPGNAAFKVRDLDPARGVSPPRLERRRALVSAVDREFRGSAAGPEVQVIDRFYRQAYDLVSTIEGRAAFDLAREPERVRDAYGRTRIGQGCLLARRLIEAGVRCVTVNDDGWDTHEKNFEQLKNKLLPGLDRAFAALLQDLRDRGLLESTLVLCMGDFSRTPTINPAAGRDHWADCISVALAGGGIRGGTVVGSSDRIGAYPVDQAMHVSRLAATVYKSLGLPGETLLEDVGGRPIPLLPQPVEPIHSLF